jgi:hypothetical protein
MSRDAKWIWNADTPASVPAGARISAGKSGSVARSLPIRAVAAAKRLPASCIPSPESPAKRTTTRSFSSVVFVTRNRRERRLSVIVGMAAMRPGRRLCNKTQPMTTSAIPCGRAVGAAPLAERVRAVCEHSFACGGRI